MSRYVPIAEQRATIQPIGSGVDISIPARRNWFFVAFFCLWLVGWAAGEWTVGKTLLFPPQDRAEMGIGLFSLVWLVGWTAGGLFVFASVLWMLFGVERVRIARDEVRLRREVFGVGRTWQYDPRAVSRLRALYDVESPFGTSVPHLPWSPLGQTLAFDYGAKTIRFGAGLDAAEARQLAGKITTTATWLVAT